MSERLVSDVIVRCDLAILVYFVLVNSFYFVLLISAGLELRRHRRRTWVESLWKVAASDLAPKITMLAPAYNEEATVVASVRALLTLNYSRLEVIVVNDGSTDGTLAALQDAFELQPIPPVFRIEVDSAQLIGVHRSRTSPQLLVVDKVNRGKADALNAGLNLSTGSLVCAIDADTIIEPDALLRMVRPFLADHRVVAVGGTIRVVNGSAVAAGRVVNVRTPRRALPGVQSVEYLRAFLFGRLGWNRLGGNLIISGAFGLFDRDAMVRSGGYVRDTVGEDMELVARLRRESYDAGTPGIVRFIPDPVAWTEVPSSLRVLGRQRDRWQRGLADVLWRNRRVAFNPRYGVLGMVVMPYFILVELLGPVIEAVGLLTLAAGLALGYLNVSFAIVFFLVAYGYGLVLTAVTLALEEFSYRRFPRLRDLALLLAWGVLENVGYRQVTVVWRLRGMWKYLRRNTEWGAMARQGFADAPP
ncbi:MAG: glycosyltransferase, partial [Acidimicrobiales bacterium]|nr:glycosyltransferase [Acidimicrobiales bacterium]